MIPSNTPMTRPLIVKMLNKSEYFGKRKIKIKQIVVEKAVNANLLFRILSVFILKVCSIRKLIYSFELKKSTSTQLANNQKLEMLYLKNFVAESRSEKINTSDIITDMAKTP